MKKRRIYSFILGIVSALFIFLLLSIITVLIPNSFFKRMSPAHYYDYIFLIATSLLFGVFIGLWHYRKSLTRESCGLAAGGTLGGLFSFGCAICNHLLVFLLGTAFITTYFMPIQPILGVISIILLSAGVYQQYNQLQKT